MFPVGQVLHAVEEYLQGYRFHSWLRSSSGADFLTVRTAAMHIGFVVAVTLATAVAVRYARARWVLVSLGLIVLLNAAAHIAGALLAPHAASGVATSVGVWIPLGSIAIANGWRQLPRRVFMAGVVVGVLVQVPLTFFAAIGE